MFNDMVQVGRLRINGAGINARNTTRDVKRCDLPERLCINSRASKRWLGSIGGRKERLSCDVRRQLVASPVRA